MQTLRQTYSTELALRSKTSLIRTSYAGAMDERGAQAACVLREACKTDDDRQRMEVLIQSYGRRGWTYSREQDQDEEGGLDGLVRSMRRLLLPQNVRDVHITGDEAQKCDQHKQRRMRARHLVAPTVDAAAWICEARRTVETHATAGLYDLTLALLLLTGRRTAEILNGRSTLTPESDAPAEHMMRFGGQLKRRSPDPQPYSIPVLHKAPVVRDALRSLRALQPQDVASRTNAQITSTYQSGLSKHMKKHSVYGSSDSSKLHLFRSVYVVLVHSHFDCGARTLQGVAHTVCGHSNIMDAMAYTALSVGSYTTDECLGRLPDADDEAGTLS